MQRFLKKITQNGNLLHTVIIHLILGIASLLPLLYSSGRLNIGYDTFIPIIPRNSYGLTYQWTDRENGIYTLNLYFIWVAILDLIQKLVSSIYTTSAMFQFMIYFLSSLGIAKTFNLFHKNSVYFCLIPAIFFIYSPHLLDHMLYQFGTIGIVWSSYFLLKLITQKVFLIHDAFFLCLSLATIVDLPNPKYHFLIMVVYVVTISLAIILKLLNIKDVKRNVVGIGSTFIFSLYLLLPFAYFAYSVSKYSHLTIGIKKNYEQFGETLDYGIAHFYKMVQLFHTPNLNAESSAIIEKPFFLLGYYVVPIIVLGLFPFLIYHLESKTDKKRYLLLYSIALFLIFLSKGSNPPLGVIYEYIVSSYQILAFMRTTAGIVIFAGVFYSLILGLFFMHAIRSSRIKHISIIVAIYILVTISYPYLSGRYFIKMGQNSYGIRIPSDYFEVANFFRDKDLDAKVLIYPPVIDYQNNSWGYYGFGFFPWLISKPTLNRQENIGGASEGVTNARYIAFDKSLRLDGQTRLPPLGYKHPIFHSKFIDVFEIALDNYLPHIYIPRNIFITNTYTGNSLVATGSTSAYFTLNNTPENLLVLPRNTMGKTSIEYKKINPTKYRIRIHRVKESFPLIFSETFHPGWKIYDSSKNLSRTPSATLVPNNIEWRESNANDRATKDEAAEYVRLGDVTTLSSPINFISKKIGGTIQNNNLENGFFTETIFLREIATQHMVANGFANSWIIDPMKICRHSKFCKVNRDGTYDIEIIAEFWPQRFTWYGLLVFFGLTIFMSVTYIYSYVSRSSKNAE